MNWRWVQLAEGTCRKEWLPWEVDLRLKCLKLTYRGNNNYRSSKLKNLKTWLLRFLKRMKLWGTNKWESSNYHLLQDLRFNRNMLKKTVLNKFISRGMETKRMKVQWELLSRSLKIQTQWEKTNNKMKKSRQRYLLRLDKRKNNPNLKNSRKNLNLKRVNKKSNTSQRKVMSLLNKRSKND